MGKAVAGQSISRLDQMQKKFNDLESKIHNNVWPKIREQHERLNNLDRSLADVADLSKQNTQVLTDSNPIKMLKDLNSFIKRCERGFKQLNKPIIQVGNQFEKKLDASHRKVQDN